MARIYDGRHLVEIRMHGSNNIDFSNDFCKLDSYSYDTIIRAYLVDDVEVCINHAYDCKYGTGDFCRPDPELEITVAYLDTVYTIASRMKSSTSWQEDDCRKLCKAAHLLPMYEHAAVSQKTAIVLHAAELLGVEIQ